MTIFKLHDSDENLKRQGAIDVTELFYDEWEKANQAGYGIFWVPNEYEGARKKENLTKINFWFCDIDGGNKPLQMQKIKALSIPPTWVIETKNGYHCYWAVEGIVTLENFEKIEKGIIQKLGGDPHCTDPLRLLRAPGYFHMKNPKEPFFVNFVEGMDTDRCYTEQQMMFYFLKPETNVRKVQYYSGYKTYSNDKNNFLDESRWEKIFKISKIVQGCRNSTLAKYTLWLRDEGLSSSDISYIINGINQKTVSPLSQSEVNRILYGKGIR